MKTVVRRVVSRVVQLAGGAQRHITYWLCYDSTPSGNAGTFFMRCYLTDRLGDRVLRESMALSGDLGDQERVVHMAFDLLTQSTTPVRPESLRYLAQDLCSRVAAQPSPDYSELLSAVKSSAAALLETLHKAERPAPLGSR